MLLKKAKTLFLIKSMRFWIFFIFLFAFKSHAQDILPNRFSDFLKDSIPDSSAHKNISLSVMGHSYVGVENNQLFNRLHLGPKLKFSKGVFTAQGAYLFYLGDPRNAVKSYNIHQNVISQIGQSNTLGHYFVNHQFIGGVRFSPSHRFSVGIQRAKFFIGEGYRSIIHSDAMSPHVYLDLQMKFHKNISYSGYFSHYREQNPFVSNPFSNQKFSSAHSLTFTIKNVLKLGFYETVMWGAKDTLLNRGFDIRYLNPFVFYRPVEYANGSSDNSLLGFNGSLLIKKKYTLYAQFMLDEFWLPEIKARNGWWANKYALQVGAKADFKINQKHPLRILGEFNTVRPFTYSHHRSLESYTNMNEPIAHPLGANFRELLGVATFKLNKKHLFDLKGVLALRGLSDSVNVGENPLVTYTTRATDYGHTILQGNLSKRLQLNFRYHYKLYAKLPLWAFVDLGYIKRSNNDSSPLISVGISSLNFNVYNDFY